MIITFRFHHSDRDCSIIRWNLFHHQIDFLFLPQSYSLHITSWCRTYYNPIKLFHTPFSRFFYPPYLSFFPFSLPPSSLLVLLPLPLSVLPSLSFLICPFSFLILSSFSFPFSHLKTISHFSFVISHFIVFLIFLWPTSSRKQDWLIWVKKSPHFIILSCLCDRYSKNRHYLCTRKRWDCKRIMLNWSLKWRLRKMKMIMMTTVMILAVIAVMIAKAVNVNNKMEMGK